DVAKHLRATSKNVRQYKLVNALSATVSANEETALRSDPSVAAVIPDSIIRATAPSAPAADAPAATRTAPANVCGTASKPIANEYLDVTHTASADSSAKTARSLGLTGAGVKV